MRTVVKKNLLIILILINSGALNAQVRDSEELEQYIFATENHMYNLEYDSALVFIKEIDKKLPNHPLPSLLYAVNRVWQTMPDAYPPDYDSIMYFLDKTTFMAERMIKENKRNPEAIFFALVSHGLKAQYLNDRGTPFKALSEAQSAYYYIKKGMDLMDEYVEFYFSTGLYNYYREKYPEVYPVYKPLVWVFRKGNIELGLEQINYAIEHAPFSAIEASHYLAFMYLRYELIPSKSEQIMTPIVNKFPMNPYFKSILIESKWAGNRIASGENEIIFLESSSNPFFGVCGKVYRALYLEEVEHNDAEAKKIYLECMNKMEDLSSATSHMKSLCNMGLGRITYREGNYDQAKSYLKRAQKDAVKPKVEQIADEYLDKI